MKDQSKNNIEFDIKFLSEALEIVKEESEEKFKKSMRSYHWSFIVSKKHGIIGWGQNSEKTHPIASKFGCRYHAIHSELAAYINTPTHYKKWNYMDKYCYMINIRINRFGELRRAAPCSSCQKFLITTGIKKVYYSIDNEISVDNLYIVR